MIKVTSLAILLSFTILTGCGGGGASTYYMHKNTTLGQELSDLQAAKNNGAITEDEYEDQRERLLAGEERK
jgi:hypothetical protein